MGWSNAAVEARCAEPAFAGELAQQSAAFGEQPRCWVCVLCYCVDRLLLTENG